MRKICIISLCSLLLLTGCSTNTGKGAYVGAQFGAILGSAVGGISGGWRGHDIGTIVGMAGGAAVGAAIGAAADQKEAERREQEQWQRRETYSTQDDSGFDPTNSGDDRIDFDINGPRNGRPTYSNRRETAAAAERAERSMRFESLVEIRHARIVDADHDGIIRAGEQCRVTFEIMNRSSMTLYDVQPTVIEVTRNKHILISPNLRIESIAPHSGIRYTATIQADRRLKDGSAVIRVGVTEGGTGHMSEMQDITVQTRRR